MLNYSLDFNRLSQAYALGQLEPEQVVHDVDRQINALAHNPIWIHRQPLEAVLQRVSEIKALKARVRDLPLYGLPFAVKDNIDVKGCPTTAACPSFAYEPTETAPVVQRLLDAGAVLIGKTNLDQFATGLVGTRSPYGACLNAFHPDYISGGSSSGSAVAVASGLVSFALGTDTAGSGRVPAGFNNIVGLKPTRGLLSTRGVVPACRSLDCVSIFSLTCEDAQTVFDCVRGWDEGDIYSRSEDLTPLSGQAPIAGKCFAIPRASEREFFGDLQAKQAFEKALVVLKQLKVEMVEIDFTPFFAVAQLLYDGPWVAERYSAIKSFLQAHEDQLWPLTREIINSAKKWSAVDTFEALYRLRDLQKQCEKSWGRVDALVVPTSPCIYTHEQMAASPIAHNSHLGIYTNFVNLLDLSALAVPGPFRDDGLPAGITLIGKAYQDGALVKMAAQFHDQCALRLGATRFKHSV